MLACSHSYAHSVSSFLEKRIWWRLLSRFDLNQLKVNLNRPLWICSECSSGFSSQRHNSFHLSRFFKQSKFQLGTADDEGDKKRKRLEAAFTTRRLDVCRVFLMLGKERKLTFWCHSNRGKLGRFCTFGLNVKTLPALQKLIKVDFNQSIKLMGWRTLYWFDHVSDCIVMSDFF